MPRILEKVERRLGEKLFLKGDRCVGPKCAMIRRAYPPGIHGKKRSRGRGSSEYRELLREKQKVRFFYSLDDGQIKRYVEKASSRGGVFGENLLRALERRLDVVVWRLGFTPSRRTARQAISHGHITVNGRPISSSSYAVEKGDVVGLGGRGMKSGMFRAFVEGQHTPPPPSWLALNKEKAQGSVAGLPAAEELGFSFDLAKVKEFYSQ